MPKMDQARVVPFTGQIYFVPEVPVLTLADLEDLPFLPQVPASVFAGVPNPQPNPAGLPADVPFVTLATSPFLDQERILVAGYGIDITDFGPNSNLLIEIDSAEILTLVSGGGFTGQVETSLNGTPVAIRGGIDFHDGPGITVAAADDPANDEVDVTISLDTTSLFLDSLADTNVPAPAFGQHLVWNGVSWTSLFPDMLTADAAQTQKLRLDPSGSVDYEVGFFTAAGDRRVRQWIMAAVTTNANPTRLVEPLAGTDHLLMPNRTAWFFEVSVVAKVQGGSQSNAWKITGLMKRGNGAPTTALVGGSVQQTLVAEDIPAMDVTVGVAAAPGGLEIVAIGDPVQTIRWVAEVVVREVRG